MEKIKMNVYVDTLAFLLFLVAFDSGLIMYLLIPWSGGNSFLSIGRGEWRTIHLFSAIPFGLMVFIHLALHFDWIKMVPKIIRGK